MGWEFVGWLVIVAATWAIAIVLWIHLITHPIRIGWTQLVSVLSGLTAYGITTVGWAYSLDTGNMVAFLGILLGIILGGTLGLGPGLSLFERPQKNSNQLATEENNG